MLKNKRLQKFLIVNIILIIVLTIVSICFYKCYVKPVMYQPRAVTSTWNANNDNYQKNETVKIESNTKLVQDIQMPTTKIDGFSLKVDNAVKSNDKILFTIKNENKELINKEIEMSKHPINGYMYIPLDTTIESNIGETLQFIISSNNITVPFNVYTTYSYTPSNTLEVNNSPLQTISCYQLNYGFCKDIFIYFLCLVALIEVMIMIISICIYKRFNIVKITIPIVLGFGILYIAIFMPFTQPDEYKHYSSSYNICNKILGQDSIDESTNRVIGYSDASLFMNDNGGTPNTSSYVNYLDGLLNKEVSVAHSTNQILMNPPIYTETLSIIPQTTGMFFGRLFHFNSYWVYTLGRLFSLVAFCILIYFAIKLIPIGKSALLTLAILPMTMQMVTSFNYDTIVIASSFLLIAYFLNLIFKKKKVGIKNIILPICMCILIVAVKPIYCAICLLWLAIPKEKFKNVYHKYIPIILALVLGLFMCIIIYNTSYRSNSVDLINLNDGFFRYVYILFNTIFSNMSLYFSSMIGDYLNWFNIQMPSIFIAGYSIILVFTILNKDKNSIVLNEKAIRNCKISLLVILLLIFSLIIGSSLFLGWSQQTNVLEGIQGRYFIPIVPLLLIYFKLGKNYLSKNIDSTLVIANYTVTIYFVLFYFHSVL